MESNNTVYDSRESFSRFVDFVERINKEIPYVANEIEKLMDCSVLFKHPLVDVVSLLQPIGEYLCKEKGSRVFKETVDGRLRLTVYNNSLLTEDFILATQVAMEGCFRGLYNIVYSGVSVYERDCFSESDYPDKKVAKVMEREAFGNFVKGVCKAKYGALTSLPEVGGKIGIFDYNGQSREYKQLLDTLVACRNFVAHSNENSHLYGNEDGGNSVRIYKRCVVALLLAVDFRYDEIVAQLGDYIQEQDMPTQKSESQIQEDVEAFIRGKYIPTIINAQESIIKSIYKRVDSQGLDILSSLIDVSLTRFAEGVDSTASQGEDYIEEQLSFSSIDLIEHMEESNFALIGGASGTGKSVVFSRLMHSCAQDFLQGVNQSSSLLPIRFNLNEYESTSRGLLDIFVDRVLSSSTYILNKEEQCVLAKLVESTIEQGRAVIFLDGVNEIPSKFIDRAVDNIVNFTKRYPKSRYIISSRLSEITEKRDMFSDFVVYELSSLSDSKIREHLAKRSVIYGLGEDFIWNIISKDENLLSFARNPMCLMMLVNILSSDSSARNRMLHINRGELYTNFISSLIKWECKTDSEFVALQFNIDAVLKHMAKRVWDNNDFRLNYRQDLIESMSNQDMFKGDVDRIVGGIKSALKVGLLTMSSDVIRFTHDSFLEFYQSRFFVDSYSKEDCDRDALLQYFDAENSTDELLRMTIELLEAHKDRRLASRFVDEFILRETLPVDKSAGRHHRLKWDEEATCFRLNGEFPIVLNPNLERLACMLSIFKSSGANRATLSGIVGVEQWSDRKSRTYIERYILNELYLYKRLNPNGYIKILELEPLFKSVAMSASKVLLDELFSPYWLYMWLIVPTDIDTIMPQKGVDESRVRYKDKYHIEPLQKKLFSTLLYNTNNVKLMVSNLLTCSVWMHNLRLYDSLKRLKYIICKLYALADDSKRKDLYLSLMRSNRGGLYADLLLFYVDDIDFLNENYQGVNSTDIPLMSVTNLLSKSDNRGFTEFIFKNINDIADIPNVLKYYLVRQKLPVELISYIRSCGASIDGGILDLMPLDKIPKQIVESIYDRKIYDYLTSDDQDLSREAVSCFVLGCSADTIEIAIPNYDYISPFDNIELILSNGKVSEPLAVQKDDYVTVSRTSIHIKPLEDLILPFVGSLIYLDSVGREQIVEYSAAASDIARGLLLHIYDVEMSELFVGLHRNDSEVSINGATCRITDIRAEQRYSTLYYRRLVVERKGDLPPFYCNFISVEGDNKDGYRPVVCCENRAVSTPYNRRSHLFKGVLSDATERQQPPHYTIYGVKGESVTLWCEPIQNNIEGCRCRLSGSDTLFEVRRMSKFNNHYVEMRFTAPINVDVRKWGYISRGQDVEAELRDIPYVYSVVYNREVILRVDDARWVQHLSDSDFVNTLFQNQTYRVRKIYLELFSVEVINHAQASVSLTLSPLSQDEAVDISAIESSGELKIYDRGGDSDTTPMMLSYSSGTRAEMCTIPSMTYLGHYHDSSIFYVTQPMSDISGSYVKLPEVLPIAEVNNHLVACRTVTYDIFLSSQIACKVGRVTFDVAAEEESLYYWVESDYRDLGRYRVCIYIGQDKGIEDLILASTVCTIDGDSYDILECSKVDNESAVVGSLLSLDNKYSLPVRYQVEGAEIKFYSPIINSIDNTFYRSAKDSSYVVSSVGYHKYLADEATLIIPKSLSIITSMYCRVDGNRALYRVQIAPVDDAILCRVSSFACCALSVVDIVEPLQTEGVISFYYDNEGKHPAKVSFELISSLIDYKHPERYHGSLCQHLVNEYRAMTYVNSHCFDFFVRKSQSGLLLNYFLELPEDKFVEVEGLRFNLHVVVKVTNSVAKIYNWQEGKDENVDSYSHELRVGDIVVREENKSITLVDRTKIKPMHWSMLGFKEGVIFKIINREKCEAQVYQAYLPKGDDPGLFFLYNPDEYTPQIGDRVAFIPSINSAAMNTGRKIATNVIYRHSSVLRGVVDSIEVLTDGVSVKVSAEEGGEKLVGTSYVGVESMLYNHLKGLPIGGAIEFYYETEDRFDARVFLLL